MKTTLRFACLLALTYVLTAFSAHAQTLRLYVASYGNDANTGSRTSPKRTFQAAHDAMSSGGNIVGLDTGGFASGTLNLTKNISISMAAGCEGIVTGTIYNAVIVAPGLRVSLRGLRIETTAANNAAGIYVNNASSVEVDNCTITGFGSGGGSVNGSGGIVITSASANDRVVVTDSVIKDCPGSGISHGAFGALPNSTLLVERCRLLSNGQGVLAMTSGRVTVRDCTVSHNTGIGIRGGGGGASDVTVNVEHCAVTGNDTGLSTFYPGNVTVSNTAITGNTTGVTGTPLTFGNNQLVNNTTDGTMGTVLTQK